MSVEKIAKEIIEIADCEFNGDIELAIGSIRGQIDREIYNADYSSEKEPNKDLSFSEAQEYLNENGSEINLEEIIVESNRERERWGFGEVDIEDVKTEVAIPKDDLQKLIENPALGSEAHLSVMDTDKTYAENNHERFEQLKKTIGKNNTTVCRSFDNYQKVDSNGKVLDNQKPTEKYRIIFTPKERNLTDDTIPEEAKELVGINAFKQREKMAEGVKIVTPDVWMSMFQRGMDQLLVEYYDLDSVDGLKSKDYKEKCKDFFDNSEEETYQELVTKYLTDSKTWTQFPDLADENGDVAGLDFGPDSREVRLYYCGPGGADDDLGSRPALG